MIMARDRMVTHQPLAWVCILVLLMAGVAAEGAENLLEFRPGKPDSAITFIPDTEKVELASDTNSVWLEKAAPSGNEFEFLHFLVRKDPTWVQGKTLEMAVEIADAPLWFSVEYDSATPDEDFRARFEPTGCYRPISWTEIEELDGPWKRVIFQIPDLRIGSRETVKADFRLRSRGSLKIRRITLQSIRLLSLPASGPLPIQAELSFGKTMKNPWLSLVCCPLFGEWRPTKKNSGPRRPALATPANLVEKETPPGEAWESISNPDLKNKFLFIDLNDSLASRFSKKVLIRVESKEMGFSGLSVFYHSHFDEETNMTTESLREFYRSPVFVRDLEDGWSESIFVLSFPVFHNTEVLGSDFTLSFQRTGVVRKIMVSSLNSPEQELRLKEAWIRELFTKTLGRKPGPPEEKALLKLLDISENGSHPWRDIKLSLILSQEYKDKFFFPFSPEKAIRIIGEKMLNRTLPVANIKALQGFFHVNYYDDLVRRMYYGNGNIHPPDARFFKGRWYKILRGSMNCWEARGEAVSLGGDCCSIRTPAENAFVAGLAKGKTVCLGGELKNGSWRWFDGSPFQYSSWLTPPPTTGQGFLMMNLSGSSGQWEYYPASSEIASSSIPNPLGFEGYVYFWSM
jgi:hypothetical protein